MCDEAHVRLVDAHAERDRRDHDDTVLSEEARLVAGPHPGIQPRVIREGVDALRAQVLGRLLDRLAAERIDDARRPGRLGTDELQQLTTRIDLRLDAVLDVRAVEARHEVPRLGEVQPLGDLLVRRTRRGRGERHARNARKALREVAERKVVGTEVVTPLADAVRLVDRDHAQRTALQERRGRRGAQSLGCDVEQVEIAGEVGLLDARALCGGLGRVQVRGVDAVGDERVDLIVHEGDEGAHDEARPGTHERGDLVRDRLAAAGGHQDDRVAAGDDLIDDRGLIPAEVVVAEDVFEDGARVLARTVTSEAGASRCGGGRDGGGWCRSRRTRQRSGVSVELGRRGAVVLVRRSQLVDVPRDVRIGVVAGVPAHSTRLAAAPDTAVTAAPPRRRGRSPRPRRRMPRGRPPRGSASRGRRPGRRSSARPATGPRPPKPRR